MAEKLGIEEVKDVVKAGLSLAELVDALADGVGISDVAPLFKVVKAAPKAVSAIKSGKVIPQLKDLDDAEKAELKQYIKDNFDLKEDGLEDVIEKALSVVVDLTDLLQVM